jgi:hypothetical protein
VSNGNGSAGPQATATADVPWEVEKGPFDQSPELFAAAAFVGGFIVARLFRKLSSG